MTEIHVKVIAASRGPLHTKPIYTVECTYPRYIHGEVLTHRVFSRNSMSSRAIPISKVLAQVWSDPAMPVEWGSNQPGMQAHTQLQGWRKGVAQFLWQTSAKVACVFAWGFIKVGLAKQVGNRILEPWQWMHTLITSTEWDNFFELRMHSDAQPEFRVLAAKIHRAINSCHVKFLDSHEWHLPYITTTELTDIRLGKLPEDDALKMSAARCARVSYLLHDKKEADIASDIKLFNRLVGSKPIHASPIEHQARPAMANYRSGNFVGWRQFRQDWQSGQPRVSEMQSFKPEEDGNNF